MVKMNAFDRCQYWVIWKETGSACLTILRPLGTMRLVAKWLKWSPFNKTNNFNKWDTGENEDDNHNKLIQLLGVQLAEGTFVTR